MWLIHYCRDYFCTIMESTGCFGGYNRNYAACDVIIAFEIGPVELDPHYISAAAQDSAPEDTLSAHTPMFANHCHHKPSCAAPLFTQRLSSVVPVLLGLAWTTVHVRSFCTVPISNLQALRSSQRSDSGSSSRDIYSVSMSTNASPEVRASSQWEGMWSSGLKKGDMFDTGVVSPALQKLLDEGTLPKGRSLVPGCGRGYDAIALGKSGYDSTGLDLSPTGIEQAKALLAEEQEGISGKVDFKSGDFFAFTSGDQGKFDVILDYTFLCALDPSARDDWADHMVSLLAPGGELVTLIFPIIEKEGGPPYAVTEALVSDLLTPRGLEPMTLEKLPADHCHKGREGKTSLGRWRFKQTA